MCTHVPDEYNGCLLMCACLHANGYIYIQIAVFNTCTCVHICMYMSMCSYVQYVDDACMWIHRCMYIQVQLCV